MDFCACEQTPEKLIGQILNRQPYICSMCDSMVYFLTSPNGHGTTCDADHAKTFSDKNVLKVCKLLKKANTIARGIGRYGSYGPEDD
jgi:hypothetical protein